MIDSPAPLDSLVRCLFEFYKNLFIFEFYKKTKVSLKPWLGNTDVGSVSKNVVFKSWADFKGFGAFILQNSLNISSRFKIVYFLQFGLF